MKRFVVVLSALMACSGRAKAPSHAGASTSRPSNSAESSGANSAPPSAVTVRIPMALPVGAVLLSGDLGALRAQEPVVFALRATDVAGLSRDLAPVHPELRVVDGAVFVERGTLLEDVLPRHREATFLVDFDTPEITKLSNELSEGLDLGAIRKLAGAQIAKHVYGSVWTASRAVRLQSGDCSEASVIAAALSRSKGLPARVVIGYVALTSEKAGVAMGHAWTQVHDGKRWVDLDATPLGDVERAYIILDELTDEGPRFATSLVQAMSKLRVSGVDVVRKQVREP